MNTKALAGTLLFITCTLVACTPGSRKKENEQGKDSTVAALDTALRGRAGVIEKNPPVQQGNYIARYPNGIIKTRGYYENGKRNGQWVSFFLNGNVQSEGAYKDGIRDGKATVYYENGKLYYEGQYKDGKEAGKWVFYNPDGKIIQEKDYDSASSSAKPNS